MTERNGDVFTTSVRLPRALADRLQRLAAAHRVSMNAEIIRAVEGLLDREVPEEATPLRVTWTAADA